MVEILLTLTYKPEDHWISFPKYPVFELYCLLISSTSQLPKVELLFAALLPLTKVEHNFVFPGFALFKDVLKSVVT